MQLIVYQVMCFCFVLGVDCSISFLLQATGTSKSILSKNSSSRSFHTFGFGANKSYNTGSLPGVPSRASHISVNITPTIAESDTPEIHKYKKRFNSDILCAALWGRSQIMLYLPWDSAALWGRSQIMLYLPWDGAALWGRSQIMLYLPWDGAALWGRSQIMLYLPWDGAALWGRSQIMLYLPWDGAALWGRSQIMLYLPWDAGIMYSDVKMM